MDDFAGKGRKENDFLLQERPITKEIVNFGEFIGYVVDPKTGEENCYYLGKDPITQKMVFTSFQQSLGIHDGSDFKRIRAIVDAGCFIWGGYP